MLSHGQGHSLDKVSHLCSGTLSNQAEKESPQRKGVFHFVLSLENYPDMVYFNLKAGFSDRENPEVRLGHAA